MSNQLGDILKDYFKRIIKTILISKVKAKLDVKNNKKQVKP